MKKIVIVLTAATVVGLTVFAVRRRLKNKAIRDRIANEGYETAEDILYPGNSRFYKKLQYGPVLPA
ncbi:MAG: hypothetical protein ABUT20_20910 [Bacteroidota bacterium]